jgi:hypothetical protein
VDGVGGSDGSKSGGGFEADLDLDGDETLLAFAHRCAGARASGPMNGRPESVVSMGIAGLRTVRRSASIVFAAAFFAKRAVYFTAGFMIFVTFDFEIAIDLVLYLSRFRLVRVVLVFFAGDAVTRLPMSGSDISSYSCSLLT